MKNENEIRKMARDKIGIARSLTHMCAIPPTPSIYESKSIKFNKRVCMFFPVFSRIYNEFHGACARTLGRNFPSPRTGKPTLSRNENQERMFQTLRFLLFVSSWKVRPPFFLFFFTLNKNGASGLRPCLQSEIPKNPPDAGGKKQAKQLC